MSVRFLRVFLPVSAVALGGFACGTSDKQQVQYQTAVVDQGPVIARVSSTGTLSPLVTVQVGSQVSGRIQSLEADYNDNVKKGQLLAQIDPDLYKAALANAHANRVAAQANLVGARVQAANAKLTLDRNTQLLQRGIIAQADFDTGKAAYDAAVASVDAAEGALEQAIAQESQAQLNLGYTEIVSPINGSVISRNVDVGQTVAASLQAPTLFLIAEDLKKMQVDTSIAEADVGKLHDGMEASFTVDAFPFDRFRGKIRQIRNNSTTVQNVVTYDAVIDVDNPDLKLRPGMTANCTMVIAERQDVLRVPNAAMRFRPPQTAGAGKPGSGGATAPGAERPGAAGRERALPLATDQRTVWRLNEVKLEPVRIRIGVTDGTLTEVVSGNLKPGDKLATDTVGRTPGAQGFRAL